MFIRDLHYGCLFSEGYSLLYTSIEERVFKTMLCFTERTKIKELFSNVNAEHIWTCAHIARDPDYFKCPSYFQDLGLELDSLYNENHFD